MATENIAPKARITNKNFRLKKSTKRILALHSFTDADQRAAFRRSMIEAQVAENTIVKREKKEFGKSAAAE
jgi:hypothetical protein